MRCTSLDDPIDCDRSTRPVEIGRLGAAGRGSGRGTSTARSRRRRSRWRSATTRCSRRTGHILRRAPSRCGSGSPRAPRSSAGSCRSRFTATEMTALRHPPPWSSPTRATRARWPDRRRPVGSSDDTRAVVVSTTTATRARSATGHAHRHRRQVALDHVRGERRGRIADERPVGGARACSRAAMFTTSPIAV